jgi:hypothetical protein
MPRLSDSSDCSALCKFPVPYGISRQRSLPCRYPRNHFVHLYEDHGCAHEPLTNCHRFVLVSPPTSAPPQRDGLTAYDVFRFEWTDDTNPL